MALQASYFPSSSSSSSFSYEWPYHVFLSFRGSDTRYGFTGNLYKALSDKGIHTFFDDQELQGGEEITPALVKAIQDSRIAVVVFSVNYASSSFCLHELATIMECVKGKGRLVLPVFYDVDPCDVRHQKGSYGEAMTKHKERFKDEKEKVQKWREALRQVANLSGEDLKLGNEYEYVCIEKIVKMISEKINHVPLHIADYPVGLQSQVLEVNSLLNDGFDCGVCMVGIYGIGGIGKTTLARAIYNFIADQFEGLCFLENVREKSIKHGLVHLQETFLSEMLGEKDIRLGSVYRGIPIIKQKLHRKKVLLVLDDVHEVEQLRATVGKADWLGYGSRVIITTRDKHLLTSHGIERNYKVEGLSNKEALQLLSWNAFKNENIDPSYMDILKHAITYACGLPLALEVIGSNLFGKSIDECISVLAQYERIPNKKIQMILEISFDALEECHKKIFLDIACCFNGYNWVEVQDILHARHDVSLKNGISVLVQKSLLMPDKYGYLTIHDLVRDMGREIIRQESPKHPGNRSRLWIPEDIVQVLVEKTGTSEIEIMILDASKLEKIVVEWNGKTFKKMKNLEILIIRNSHFSQGAKHLPSCLRVLEWWNYPSNSLPYDFYPKKLAIFKLPESSLMSVGFIEKRKFMNLKVLKFDNSDIEYIPDVSGVPNLEELSFRDCGNLIKVHESVGFLDKLSQLGVSGCRKLRSFPALMLPCLKELDFLGCSSLENFPKILGDMEGLTSVYLYSTSIKELPDSFIKLRNLEYLKIGHVDGVLRLSSGISMLHNLNVQVCGKLQFLIQDKDEGQGSSMVSSAAVNFSFDFYNTLDEFSAMFLSLSRRVVTLDLSGNDFTILQESTKELCSLRKLTLDDCKELREIRGIPPNIEEFSARNRIFLIRMLLNEFMNLKVLKFDNSDIEYIPDVFGVPNLEELSFRDCGNLIKVHKSIGLLDKLSQLGVSGCSKLRSFPALMLPGLAELNFWGCSSLENFPDILGEMEALAHVNLTGTSIKELPYSITYLWNLKSLRFGNLLNNDFNVRGYGELQFPKQDEDGGQGSSMFSSIAVEFSFDTLDEFFAIFRSLFHCVVTLDVSGNDFAILPESVKELCWLRKLTLDDCKELKEIRGIPPNIEEFSIANCKSLTPSCISMLLNEVRHVVTLNLSRNDFTILPGNVKELCSLRKLTLDDCWQLREIRGIPPNIEEFSAADCMSLIILPKSIKELFSLRKLNLDGCKQLREIGGIPPNIEEFSVADCMSLSILPESIKELCSLRKLNLDGCEQLREIRGIPHNIEEFSAANCMSLTPSCISMLLNEEYYSRNGYKWFYLPGGSIPKWFEHRSRNSISFWFRNKPLSISLCIVSRAGMFDSSCIEVSINGNKTLVHLKELYDFMRWAGAEDHIAILNLGTIRYDNELAHELLSEIEWNHVVFSVVWNIKGCPLEECIGIHVHKHESNMEDIRFTDPLLQEKEVNMGDFHRDTEHEKNLTTLASVEMQQGNATTMNSLNDDVNGDLNSGGADLSKDKGKDLTVYNHSSEKNSLHSCGQELPDKNWESNSMKLASTSDTIREGSDDGSWKRDKELLSLHPCWEEPSDCENSESNLMQLASTSDTIKDQGCGESSRKRKRSALMLDLNTEPMDSDSDSIMARLASDDTHSRGVFGSHFIKWNS